LPWNLAKKPVLTSPLTPIHESSGARLQSLEGDATRVLTYGDVPAEYRAGTEACLVLDTSTRGAIRVRGAEAAAFLHRLLANDVKGLAPGRGNHNLLLSPKGKVLHEFELAPEAGGGFHLSTPAGQAGALLEALDMYLFAEAVELEEVTEQHAPLELAGPGAVPLAGGVLGSQLPGDDHHPLDVTWNGHVVRVTRLQVAGSPGLRLDAGPGGIQALWEALVGAGAVPGGVVVTDILRVEAGGARFGQDITDDVYPQEARLEDAFSLDKGCYIGQEVVAKIDTYGGLNKQLQVLAVDHDDPVPPGTRLVREQDGHRRDLGVVTSWAYSFVKDTGLVLAYVKRKHQEVGTRFELEGSPGQAEIVAWPVRG